MFLGKYSTNQCTYFMALWLFCQQILSAFGTFRETFGTNDEKGISFNNVINQLIEYGLDNLAE